MDIEIRQAQAADASNWIELLKASLGEDYPNQEAYDVSWISQQLAQATDHQTWIAQSGSSILSSISLLLPIRESRYPIANLGRHLIHPSAYENGAAERLLTKMIEVAAQQDQMIISRVLASDNTQQRLYENAGFQCVGFQPSKHLLRMREGVLFYLYIADHSQITVQTISESLPQVHELASAVLANLKVAPPSVLRDGAVGYPLQAELDVREASFQDYQAAATAAATANPPLEISGAFNQGAGLLRTPSKEPMRSLLAGPDGKSSAGLAFHFDPIDRCIRVIEAFSSDDTCMGILFQRIVKLAQERFSAVYLEVDILMNAPRLLKSAEQLGFVAVAYFPAFFSDNGRKVDIVKMVKLNTVYSPDGMSLTAQAKQLVQIVDHNFQDQKLGVAIINLLSGLPIFEGLGDGELRKIARLFTQKLYRPTEKIFNKGDSGNEAYVVMRGQIDIQLEDNGPPIASIGNGQIFGELAFLDGAARGAMAVAKQPSILLVMQRSAFNNLVQHEPHLGMVVTRNIAMELSNRLRKANASRR